MNGKAQCTTTEVCVPEHQIPKIKRIAARMRFEAGEMTYEEHKNAEKFRCCKCGELNLDGIHLDIGYFCHNCSGK